MSSVSASPPDVMTQHLVDHPEIHAALDEVHGQAWATVDGRLLELCRLRVAALLGVAVEVDAGLVAPELAAALPRWPSAPEFSDTDRACLAFAEQWVIDVASMSDALATAVVAALGADGAMDFANALLVVEQRIRMASTWTTLFSDAPDPIEPGGTP